MADNMSFLPEDYVERRAQRRTNVICLTLFVIVTIGTVAAFYVSKRQDAQVRNHQAQVNANYEEAAKRIEQLEQLQLRKKEMIRKAKITSVLIERVPRSIVLAELTNNMPTTLSLTEFKLETRVIKQAPAAQTALDKAKDIARKKRNAEAGNLNETAEPEVKPTMVRMELMGVAPTDVQVAQFMTSLGLSELFEDVSLIFSEQTMIEDQEMRKFRIELVMNQAVDLSDSDPEEVQQELQQNPMGETIQINIDGNLVLPDKSPDTTDASVASVPDHSQDSKE